MPDPTDRAEHILGGALVEASKSFTGLADAVLTKVAERGTTADVVEVVADYLDGYDALDDDNIALIHRAQAAVAQPTDEPTEADPTEAVAVSVDTVRKWAEDERDSCELACYVLALLDDYDRLRALVGGRSAAPTRDADGELRAATSQLIDVLTSNWPLVALHDTALGAASQKVIDVLSRSAAPTRDELAEAVRPWFPYRGDGLDDERVTGAADAVMALLSRSAAEPNEEAGDGR